MKIIFFPKNEWYISKSSSGQKECRFDNPAEKFIPKPKCVISVFEIIRVNLKNVFCPVPCSSENVACSYGNPIKISSLTLREVFAQCPKLVRKERKTWNISVSTKCSSGHRKGSICNPTNKISKAGRNFSISAVERIHFKKTWFSIKHVRCNFDNPAKKFTLKSRTSFAQHQQSLQNKSSTKIVYVKLIIPTCQFQFR